MRILSLKNINSIKNQKKKIIVLVAIMIMSDVLLIKVDGKIDAWASNI